MYAHERHQAILHALRKRAPLKVPQLERMLQASPATVRRDLTFLENLGKIVRIHGSVLHPEQADGEVSFDRKSRAALNAKIAIAEAAVGLVKEGDTIFVDAGSTTLEAGKRLLRLGKLTIFTNSIPLLNERPAAGISLVALGGDVRSVSLALTGGGALEWVRRIRIDVAFMGASGIDPTEGPTTTELSEAGVKSAVVAKARRVVLLADASKWGQTAAIRYADWAQIQDIVTDYVTSRTERTALFRHGARIHLVKR